MRASGVRTATARSGWASGRDELTRVAVLQTVNACLADLRIDAERFPRALAKVVAVHRRCSVAETVAVEAEVYGGDHLHRICNCGFRWIERGSDRSVFDLR